MAKKGRLARKKWRRQHQKEEQSKKRRKIESHRVRADETAISVRGPFIPFAKDEKVLLVGEGDFSFALSIISEGYIEPTNLIATSFDTLEQLEEKYPLVAKANVSALRNLKVGKILHGIDATKLNQTLKLSENPKKVNKNRTSLGGFKINLVMFNFPHVGRGIKDQDRNIKANQELLVAFYESCKEFFDLLAKNRQQEQTAENGGKLRNDGDIDKIAVTVFEGEPYESWHVKDLAKSTINYKVRRSGKFDWKAYEGYHHRKTVGMQDTTKAAYERKARIYLFEKFRKAITRKRKYETDDESSDDAD
ncbi:DEKNAAC104937 [Brettanomyces naardenensis]|uniref:DEKNAAC104937 n=1 Tax=Brettanomyces naardenensis TaxID=13370 RepID=A0A448YSE2_BRENA|nr:DEKNAAC104937 [Brettanomyces naardenensis]